MKQAHSHSQQNNNVKAGFGFFGFRCRQHGIFLGIAVAVYYVIVAVAVLHQQQEHSLSMVSETSYRGSTWSVVALDKETGEVGVAAASCVGEIHIGALASLVPGYGAASTQAFFDIDNRNLVFDLLQSKMEASGIIDSVADTAYDSDVNTRQYGIVTITDTAADGSMGSNGTGASTGAEIGIGIDAAGYTGSDNDDWAGDSQNSQWAVSVQGNILENENVVNDALSAFQYQFGSTDSSDNNISLSDRILRALEAGSSAGGDKRCNVDGGVQQTASAAFIMVAKSTDGPFAVTTIGEIEQDRDDAPWLYLSVAEPSLGGNPLLPLREQYDAWRLSSDLPDCNTSTPATAGTSGETTATATGIVNTCNLDPIVVPSGGDSDAVRKSIATALLVVLILVGAMIVGCCCGIYYCCVVRK